jgi:hypothetical protein
VIVRFRLEGDVDGDGTNVDVAHSNASGVVVFSAHTAG